MNPAATAGVDDEACPLCDGIDVVRYQPSGRKPRPFCTGCGRTFRAVVVVASPLTGHPRLAPRSR